MTKPVVGLMLGDMTGIGPEIAAKVLAAGQIQAKARLLVVGDARVLRLGMRDAGVDLAYRVYERPEAVDWSRPEVPLIDLGNIDPEAIPRGEISAESGRLTGETLRYMTDLALAGQIDGITFAPLNKAGLNQGGWRAADEHQLFAQWTRHTAYFGEMNVLGSVWTSRVTGHIPFAKVLEQLTGERILEAITLAHQTLKRVGVTEPRLAVAALNPHGGEGGLFGDEEITIIRPAVEMARKQGMRVDGPFPADTIFLKAFAGQFDSVVSMYHDQGQIATKLRGFNQGITVTAGLPTVYTTPSHGTAYDIVGKAQANTGALEAALDLAARLAAPRLAEQGSL